MRTLWRILARTVFWSFERGTWPYDVAVALIVVFVLLSPRSWFHDRPIVPVPNPAVVELRGADPAGVEIFRVDARLLAEGVRMPESELEHQLHETVSRNVQGLQQSGFEIIRIDPVRNGDGKIAFYDVSVRP